MCSCVLQEPTLGDVNAAKVHMSAPGNTNVYVGNLPVEVCNPISMCSVSQLLPAHMSAMPPGNVFCNRTGNERHVPFLCGTLHSLTVC